MEHGVGLPDGDYDISMETDTAEQARQVLTDAQFTVHPLPERSDQTGHAQLVRWTSAHGLAAATDPRADGAAIVAMP
jgi:gamma-glutamyltranspeptidase